MKRIHGRKRPGIEVDITVPHKTIYYKTVRILYGENRLLHCLRDLSTPRQVVNVEELSPDDSRDADIVSEADDGASDSDDDEFGPSDDQDDADDDVSRYAGIVSKPDHGASDSDDDVSDPSDDQDEPLDDTIGQRA